MTRPDSRRSGGGVRHLLGRVDAGGLTIAALAAVAGTGVVMAPGLSIAAVVLVALLLVVVVRPHVAAYLYLGIFPLVVGIDRGGLLALLRPNEALLAFLWMCVVIAAAVVYRDRGGALLRLHPLDVGMITLSLLSSVFSLGTLYARGLPISGDDITYSLTVWKLFAVYSLIRVTIRSVEQAMVAVRVTVVAGAVVAVIGILQAVGIQAVTSQLVIFSSDLDPLESVSNNRASSTIGAAIPFADFTAILAVVAWALAGTVSGVGRTWLRGAAVVFALACIASGQASGAVALLVALTVLGAASGRLLGYWLLAAVLGVCAMVVLEPVISARFSQIDSGSGLPDAWTGPNGRIANLRTYVVPRIMEDFNWLLGVRPSTRIPAPEGWREWVYIENGYLWLLWVGGLPFLVAFMIFLRSIANSAMALIERVDPALYVIGVGALTCGWLLAVLMVLDPHFTYRGSSDLIVAILALCASATTWQPRVESTGVMPVESDVPVRRQFGDRPVHQP